MITYKFGKKIDSAFLKRDLNKIKSVTDAKNFSLNIKPGTAMENCPVCRNKEIEFLQAIYGFKYYECKYCGVAFVADPPVEKDIERIYSTEYYSNMNKVLLANDNIINYRVENIAKPKVDYIQKNITTNKKSWLDIGCGVGEILSVVSSRGWKAQGIETNELESEYAKNKFGLNIEREYLNETNISKYSNKFGVISLFGVLEHLLRPQVMIKNIASLQEQGDNLIIEVPHFPSISAICQVTFPDLIDRVMHPPLHLFLFSLKSLEVLLKSGGYQIRHAWFFGQDFYEFLCNIARRIHNFHDSVLYEKMDPLINDFQQTIDSQQLSDEILVIAEKCDI